MVSGILSPAGGRLEHQGGDRISSDAESLEPRGEWVYRAGRGTNGQGASRGQRCRGASAAGGLGFLADAAGELKRFAEGSSLTGRMKSNVSVAREPDRRLDLGFCEA